MEIFLIAEMSGNHNQSLQRGLDIINAAAKSGVQAIKLQTYTADTITLDVRGGDFEIKNNDSLWAGKNLHDLYKMAYTPWEWHEPLMRRAKDLGLVCFSSPFDETAVDFLETLKVPCYKIASFENNHLPLIKKVASTGKPIIMSTGMATIAELDEAVTTARKNGCKDLTLLKCTSTYPASPENSNLLTIPHLRDLFGCKVGLSDHTLGIGASVAAIALGATVIEKHFTLSRLDGGVDSAFSMEPAEMDQLVKECKAARLALGEIKYGPTPAEEKSLIFRRSIYVAKDMKEGDVFTTENLKIVRPGKGLEPAAINSVLGRKINRDAKKGTPLSWELI
jgi:N-acetylneuraminate synthase